MLAMAESRRVKWSRRIDKIADCSIKRKLKERMCMQSFAGVQILACLARLLSVRFGEGAYAHRYARCKPGTEGFSKPLGLI
jgi:hypothetical protein